MRAFVRLLVTLAVLVMPFGMSAAPANASHHAAMTNMPTGHCPDQSSGHKEKGALAECTMACAASLPAMDRVPAERLKIVCEPMRPGATERLHGLHPETATPPPKRS